MRFRACLVGYATALPAILVQWLVIIGLTVERLAERPPSVLSAGLLAGWCALMFVGGLLSTADPRPSARMSAGAFAGMVAGVLVAGTTHGVYAALYSQQTIHGLMVANEVPEDALVPILTDSVSQGMSSVVVAWFVVLFISVVIGALGGLARVGLHGPVTRGDRPLVFVPAVAVVVGLVGMTVTVAAIADLVVHVAASMEGPSWQVSLIWGLVWLPGLVVLGCVAWSISNSAVLVLRPEWRYRVLGGAVLLAVGGVLLLVLMVVPRWGLLGLLVAVGAGGWGLWRTRAHPVGPLELPRYRDFVTNALLLPLVVVVAVMPALQAGLVAALYSVFAIGVLRGDQAWDALNGLETMRMVPVSVALACLAGSGVVWLVAPLGGWLTRDEPQESSLGAPSEAPGLRLLAASGMALFVVVGTVVGTGMAVRGVRGTAVEAVFAVRHLHPGVAIERTDVSTFEANSRYVPLEFASVDEVIGRVPTVDVFPNDVLALGHFRPASSESLAPRVPAGSRLTRLELPEPLDRKRGEAVRLVDGERGCLIARSAAVAGDERSDDGDAINVVVELDALGALYRARAAGALAIQRDIARNRQEMPPCH